MMGGVASSARAGTPSKSTLSVHLLSFPSIVSCPWSCMQLCWWKKKTEVAEAIANVIVLIIMSLAGGDHNVVVLINMSL